MSKPKTYKVSRVTSLNEIDFKADNDEELMKFYYGGVVDAVLSDKKEQVHYKITDQDGKIVYEHKFT